MRNLFLLSVKYIPAIMALTCCLKMFIFEYTEYEPNIINFINVILDAIIVVVFYITGRVFKFCYKHQNICIVTLIGYGFYLAFILFNIHSSYTVPICIFYILIIIIMLLKYKSI